MVVRLMLKPTAAFVSSLRRSTDVGERALYDTGTRRTSLSQSTQPRSQILDEAKLEQYPQGYKCLAYCQELTMGVTVLRDMPGHRRDVGTACEDKHDLLYQQAKDWLNRPHENDAGAPAGPTCHSKT